MLKVFNYIEEIDAFVVTEKFKEIVDYLGVTEWNEVVWIGRYFHWIMIMVSIGLIIGLKEKALKE